MNTTKEDNLRTLQEGTLLLEGQFVYGSNTTLMVTAQLEGREIKAVYKPVRGRGRFGISLKRPSPNGKWPPI